MDDILSRVNAAVAEATSVLKELSKPDATPTSAALDQAGLPKELPALRVGDARFLIKRLEAGKTAGVLSKRQRVEHIGEPQALVDIEKGEVYGIVTQGGPIPFNDIKDIAKFLKRGISKCDLDGVGASEGAFYLPVSLLVKFDPPVVLRKDMNKRSRTIDFVRDTKPETVVEPACGESSPTKSVRLLKRDTSEDTGGAKEERFVFGVVLVPEDVDAQGEIYDAETVRVAAHSFMETNKGAIKLMHQGRAIEGAHVLETYVTKQEEVHGGETFPAGTWLMAVRVTSDRLWEAVKAGEFTGFSIGGSALQERLS